MSAIIYLFVFLFSGMPIVFALFAATIAFLWVNDLGVVFPSIPSQIFESLDKNGLLAIPLFLLAGELMNRGGLTQRMIAAAEILVGRARGGLAYVNLITNALAAAILGSATAQISVMSRVMVPAMEEKGYDRGFAGALTVSGGLLGPVVPPSMIMIIYGVIAQQPIAALFVAGIVPGLLILLGFALVILIVAMTRGLPRGERVHRDHVGRRLAEGLLPGVIPVVVIAGILSGAMTPTESGAVASMIAFLLATLFYRQLSLKELPTMLVGVARSTAIITTLIAAASALGWVLTFEGVPDMLIEHMTALSDSPLVFLTVLSIAIIVLGTFLESLSVLVVVVPIVLAPAIAMGIDPVQLGVVLALGTLIGLVTPPVGPGLYIVMSQTDVRMGALFKAMVPFIGVMLVGLAIAALAPWVSLWLPQAAGLM